MTYWNDWDGQTLRIATKDELIYYLYKTVKRHSYIEIYRHVFIYKYQGCFRSQFGSINIKEVRIVFECWRDGNNIMYRSQTCGPWWWIMYSVLGTWGTPVFLWTESYNGGIEIREALAQIFREFSESFMIRECDKVLLQTNKVLWVSVITWAVSTSYNNIQICLSHQIRFEYWFLAHYNLSFIQALDGRQEGLNFKTIKVSELPTYL